MLALLKDGEHGVVVLPAGYKHNSRTWQASATDIEGGEVCSNLELAQNLPPVHRGTLTLARISKTSLDDGPVFMVCQKSETLNQTNNLLL